MTITIIVAIVVTSYTSNIPVAMVVGTYQLH